jgi:hypothetical protein
VRPPANSLVPHLAAVHLMAPWQWLQAHHEYMPVYVSLAQGLLTM